MLLQTLAPVMPFYLFKINGKVNVELDPEDTKMIFDQPEAQMANVNMHDLLMNMSPWGTINDLELINYDDEDGSQPPIWMGIEGHDKFETTAEAA